MKRIGIYSGTFDPVHTGHIAFALAACGGANLDKVIFVPEPSPRQKPHAASLDHRVAMLRSATKKHPRLGVAVLESPQFTVERTLPELKQLFPDAQLSLLMGSDTALSLAAWPDLEQLVNFVDVIVGLRGNHTATDIQPIFDSIAKQYGAVSYQLIAMGGQAEVASTSVRSGNLQLVPAEAAAYIQSHRLYV